MADSEPIVLHLGDCIEVMRGMAAESVDAIVCDPPYEYGFMSKKWDRSGIAFRPETWEAALRVLKSGGYLVAYGGTRTYHRLVCAIEDAGFEIRDSIHWLYGCLSEDSEILTAEGWRLGVEVREGEMVAAWDSETGRIDLRPVEAKTLAPWDGSLVRFMNDDTDQLLTPNHRVYHQPWQREMRGGVRRAWYNDRFEIAEAGSIGRWNGIKLPVAGIHDGPGIGGEDYAALLGWAWTEGGFDHAPSRGVRIYQSPSANPDKVAEIDALLARVASKRKRYERERTYRYKGTEKPYTEACWFFTGEIAERVRADLPGKHPTWSLLWRMTEAEKRSFWAAAMKGDGSGDDFYQKDRADLEWAQALVATLGMRGKIAMRSAPRDGGSLCVTPRDTTELQARHLRHASAHYSGNVWCVKVATGAFVARRAGKVFITGNSGFPKSLDISKAIDKRLGASRRPTGEVHTRHGGGERAGQIQQLDPDARETPVTLAGSPEAAQWEGWGTALKPGHEPIVLARKPVVGTIAENVLAHGVGGLNVDGCRVEGVPRSVPQPKFNSQTGLIYGFQAGEGRNGELSSASGRWPPNVLLTHSVSCRYVGTRDEPSPYYYPGELEQPTRTVEVWDCESDCPVAELDRQSGNLTSGTYEPHHVAAGGGLVGSKTFAMRARTGEDMTSYGDSGGASRYYPCFRYVAKPSRAERDEGCGHLPVSSGGEATDREDGSAGLNNPRAGAGRQGGARNIHPTVKPVEMMKWLCRLVTPPNGVVLDPFLGSGTTGVAAVAERFRFRGIELSSEYLEIAKARIEYARTHLTEIQLDFGWNDQINLKSQEA